MVPSAPKTAARRSTIGVAGALVTWTLMNRAGRGFNMASGLPSLAVCGVLALGGIDPSAVPATAFFGGTFVGGTTVARLPGAAWLGLAGLLYGAVMIRLRGPQEGHVGVLGVCTTSRRWRERADPPR